MYHNSDVRVIFYVFIHSGTSADATDAATIVHSSSPALLLLFVVVTALLHS